MIEIKEPINEEMLKEGRDNTKQRIDNDPKLNTRYKIGELKNALTYYPDAEFIFNYDEKMGLLYVNLWIGGINMVLNTSIMLSPNDKVSILNFINKDNNRIKSQIEEMQHMIKLSDDTKLEQELVKILSNYCGETRKNEGAVDTLKRKLAELESDTKEHKTDSLKPYYDSITSKEIKDGIEWSYIKDGKVEQTAFMSYKTLYEIQIEKPKACKFCYAREDIELISPRMGEDGIWICKQHMKYISRISDKMYGENYYYIRKSDGEGPLSLEDAYKLNPEVLSKDYILYSKKNTGG